MTLLSEKTTRLNRWLHLALAAWLFASAFTLPHSEASQGNTWVIALMCGVVAIVAIAGVHRAPVLNSIFAAWLFTSTLIVPYASTGTRFHNAVLAIIVFVLGLFPLKQPAHREELASRGAAA